MSETALRRYGEATRSAVSPNFSAKVFTGCGLDRYVCAASVLGDVFVAWNANGVSALRLAEEDAAFEAWFGERFARGVVPALEEDPTSAAARAQLAGQDVAVPIDLSSCSAFERHVLERAAVIPAAQARPYGLIARELGRPEATRAVGNALGRNPVPLLIPCHRVVRTDFSLGGYVFGSEAKRVLLEREGLDLDAVHEVVRHGFRYIRNDDRWFCLPTCGDIATRWQRPGYGGLHTLEEAQAHGLIPCGLCRPVAA